MANALISFMDLTKREGNDSAVGLLEDTITYAPELGAIMGRPINGTTYKTCHRTLPTVAFRQPNNGSSTVKGTYRQVLHETAIIDAQLMADKAVVDAEMRDGGEKADILIDEADGVVRATYITVGAQVWYGTGSDANGFQGVNVLTAASNATGPTVNLNPAVLKAGGSTANAQTSVYFIWENIKGAHFIFGNNRGLDMLPEWRIQQVNGANGLPLTAFVNNLQGWLGFAVNHPKSVARIANINLTNDNSGVTDKLIAQLLSFLPIQMRQEISASANVGAPTKWGPGLKMFMNTAAGYMLQQSRSPVYSNGGSAITAADQLNFAKLPDFSNGVPIFYTDSILNTEAVIS